MADLLMQVTEYRYAKRKNYISKSVRYTDVRVSKEHFQSLFCCYYLVEFIVGTPGGTTNIDTLFDLCPPVLKHVDYRS